VDIKGTVYKNQGKQKKFYARQKFATAASEFWGRITCGDNFLPRGANSRIRNKT
jgi:hypothetical protein